MSDFSLSRPSLWLPVLACVLLLSVLVSLALGGVQIPLGEVCAALLAPLRGDEASVAHQVVLAIRLPRVLLAATVGMTLGIGGAALQGLLRNPLVDASFVGASSGAALGATLMIVLGHDLVALLPSALQPLATSAASMLGSLLMLQFTLQFARVDGQLHIALLLLVGVALSALAGTIIGLCITFADDAQARTITFWSLGSFGGANARALLLVLAISLPGMALLLPLSRQLDALSLGEREAAHLGVDVAKVKLRVLLLVAAIVGVSVSMVGQVGFVGLVVPHLIRLQTGPRHRALLLGSALGGGLLLVISDTLARTIALPAEIPIGVITGALGAPFFLLLLRQQRSRLS